MIRRVGRGISLVAALAAAAPAPAGTAPAPPGLVEIRSQVLVIGAEGTRAAGRDRVVLALGKTGLMRAAVDLPGASGPGERIQLAMRVRWAPEVEKSETDPVVAPGEPAVQLVVDSTARVDSTGEAVLRSGGGTVTPFGSILYEAYASEASGRRIVVHFQARPWDEGDPLPGPEAVLSPQPVIYRVWIYRKTLEGTELLGTPMLSSLVGRTASYTFGFVLDDPSQQAGVRQQLEVRVLGVDLREGSLTGRVTLAGEILSKSVQGASDWTLESGEYTSVSIDLGLGGGDDLGFDLVLAAEFGEPGGRPAG